MKITICVFILCFLSACNNDIDKKYNFLIKKWGLYDSPTITTEKINGEIVTTETSVLCNVCPTIVFNENHMGSIENPGKQVFPFNWNIKDNKLTFDNTIKKENVPINDGEYFINYNENTLELINSDTSGNKIHKYILR